MKVLRICPARKFCLWRCLAAASCLACSQHVSSLKLRPDRNCKTRYLCSDSDSEVKTCVVNLGPLQTLEGSAQPQRPNQKTRLSYGPVSNSAKLPKKQNNSLSLGQQCLQTIANLLGSKLAEICRVSAGFGAGQPRKILGSKSVVSSSKNLVERECQLGYVHNICFPAMLRHLNLRSNVEHMVM